MGRPSLYARVTAVTLGRVLSRRRLTVPLLRLVGAAQADHREAVRRG